ncbi:uncharacterized protein LOC119838103 [Zerene cesonia]|uniref:uncharacterized protein LOC119838103 n=1 Tax=Zerene cesonia TaxID=33412 RepID=UPI0018E4F8BB|nr:uncharacterized protein LOC119838103 [Zerene cesonia]
MAYVLIGESFELLNSVFNMSLFFTILTTFVYTLISIWMFIYSYRYLNKPPYMFILLIWIGCDIFVLGIISYACEGVSKLRDCLIKSATDAIINSYHSTKQVRSEFKVFMYVLECWKLEIDVFQMYQLNKRLMIRFISVCTTYLIFLLQISHLM